MPRAGGPRGASAYTMVEMMVAMTIFCLAVTAVMYAMLFGQRYNELVLSKLGASEQSRMGFDKLTSDIRTAKIWCVGNGSQSSFSSIPNGTLQQGNAVQLSQTADTNSFIRYYFDTVNQQLCRVTNGMTGYKIIARSLTNNMYFRAENYQGSNVFDLQYKYVVRVMMEFCQYQYPLTKVGPGYYYNYYKMEFKITPHCPDGA